MKHIKLTVNYMIGDADGNAYKECKISLTNPFLPHVLSVLDKMKPMQGY